MVVFRKVKSVRGASLPLSVTFSRTFIPPRAPVKTQGDPHTADKQARDANDERRARSANGTTTTNDAPKKGRRQDGHTDRATDTTHTHTHTDAHTRHGTTQTKHKHTHKQKKEEKEKREKDGGAKRERRKKKKERKRRNTKR